MGPMAGVRNRRFRVRLGAATRQVAGYYATPNVIQITVSDLDSSQVAFRGRSMQANRKAYGRNWVARGRFILLTLVGVAVPAIAFSQINDTKDEITGTVSQSEPPIKQDGSPAHPYSDASQCPTRTDLIFWPSGRSVPSIPPSIAVCFVGNQPFESSGPDQVEMLDYRK
jgi:hypothetical protein